MGQRMPGRIMIQRYWSNYAANSLNFITSVNWLKLRSLSLTYDFTNMLKNQKVIKGISATATRHQFTYMDKLQRNGS